MVLRFFIVSSVASFSLSSNSTFGVESAGSKSCSFVSFASASMVEHLSSSYGLTVPSNSAMLALRLVSFVTLGEDLHQVFAGAVRRSLDRILRPVLATLLLRCLHHAGGHHVWGSTCAAGEHRVDVLVELGRSLSGELFLSDDRPVKELARGFESVAGMQCRWSHATCRDDTIDEPAAIAPTQHGEHVWMTSLKLEPTSDDKNSRSRHQVRVPKHPHSLRKERDV